VGESFSLTQSMRKGWNIRNQGLKFVLTKDNNWIVFDKVIKAHNGHINGIELVPVTTVANVTVDQGWVMDINTFHRSMAHIHQDALSKTADYYGNKLRGKFNTCFECSLAKIRQQNVGKDSENRSSVPGERLLVDISSVNVKSCGGNRFWVLVMDDCTSMCWSIFVSAKPRCQTKWCS
jgi:hypothetical protein